MKKADLESRFGTSLQGRFIMPYDILVAAIGEPHWSYMDDDEAVEDKVDVEWVFEFSDGIIVTIYNWKDGKAYLGEDGLDVENMVDWHVGGKSGEVVYRLMQYINAQFEGLNDNEIH